MTNPLSANPQNGQTHSNNSSTTADGLFVFDHFVGLALKGLIHWFKWLKVFEKPVVISRETEKTIFINYYHYEFIRAKSKKVFLVMSSLKKVYLILP